MLQPGTPSRPSPAAPAHTCLSGDPSPQAGRNWRQRGARMCVRCVSSRRRSASGVGTSETGLGRITSPHSRVPRAARESRGLQGRLEVPRVLRLRATRGRARGCSPLAGTAAARGDCSELTFEFPAGAECSQPEGGVSPMRSWRKTWGARPKGVACGPGLLRGPQRRADGPRGRS